jgi:predicted phage terminase large subunit-like protein
MRNLPSLQLRAAAELERRRRAAKPLTFREYVDKVRPGYKWYKHCIVLAEILQDVADGKRKRLMIFMPPRHGKSEEISRLFSAYYLYRFPSRWVGINSYGAELAYTLSRASRENYLRGGGLVKDDAAAVKHWETKGGGGLWAAGVGGPITGKGWHLGIIDDPVKNAKEASSRVVQQTHQEWYQSTFYTREEPNDEGSPDGALIVIQTRWHESDLSGWLLAQEIADDASPEGWHLVSFEAIKEAEPQEFPPTCTVELDWREAGQALCPERRPLEKLKRIAKAVGSYFWAAVYQQKPQPREGSLFKWAWFENKIVQAAPAVATRVRYWDTAGTEGQGDYTVGTLVARTSDGRYWIEDVVRGQWAPGHRNQRIKETADRDGKQVTIWLEREAGVGGVARTQETIRILAGYIVKTEPATGSKIDRADGLAAQAEVGNVSVVKGPWNAAFFKELLEFPYGSHDDQVDSASGGFNKVAATPSHHAPLATGSPRPSFQHSGQIDHGR